MRASLSRVRREGKEVYPGCETPRLPWTGDAPEPSKGSRSPPYLRAVEEFESIEQEGGLELRLQEINRDFLQFVHRFHFTGVSGQLQAQELNAQLRARMNLPHLFADIKDEITSAVAFLSMRAQRRQAEAVERLTRFASIGLVAGLAFSFLGMNVLMGGELWKNCPWFQGWTGQAGLVAGVTGAFALLGAGVVKLLDGAKRKQALSLPRWLAIAGGLLLLLSGGLIYLAAKP